MICRDDLSGHSATPFGATWLIRQRLSDKGKHGPLGLGFLDSPVSQRQPLPWLGTRRGLVWLMPFDPHPGAGDFVTRPAVHVIQNIRPTRRDQEIVSERGGSN
jgi:hypothetical protein